MESSTKFTSIRVERDIGQSLFQISAYMTVMGTVPSKIILDGASSDGKGIFSDVATTLRDSTDDRAATFDIYYRSCTSFQHARWLAPKFLFRDRVLKLVSDNDLASDYDLVVGVTGAFGVTEAKYKEYIDKAISNLPDINIESKKKSDIRVLIVAGPYQKINPSSGYEVRQVGIADAWSIMFRAKNLLIYPDSFLTYWAGYLGYHDRVFMPTYGWEFIPNQYQLDLTSATVPSDLLFEGVTAILP